jgi:DeoR family fructose operon transcriptional repressor
MLIIERQQKVLDMLRQQKTAQLDDLASQLSVSGSTIRRDLEVLEQQGKIERTRAGAIYIETTNGTTNGEIALTARLAEHAQQKKIIGTYAANLVKPQMTVLLDGGSTIIIAAELITARPIQVVTNSIAIAHLFKDDDQVELILAGGNLYPRTETTVGPIATGTLADLHADLLLFSLAGIYDDAAFNINLSMARVEQMMMQQATRSILLMDSSKFGRKSLVRVCGVGEVDTIVTDGKVDSSWCDQLGDRLVVAQDE